MEARNKLKCKKRKNAGDSVTKTLIMETVKQKQQLRKSKVKTFIFWWASR
jgi:hypothetical protein